MIQYEYELERSNASLKHQEDLVYILTERNDHMKHSIQQRQEQIIELESEIIQLDDTLIKSK